MSHVDRILSQWARERPDLDTTPMGLTGRIGRIARHIGREIEEGLRAFDLNLASFDVLATLRRAGEPYTLSPGDLLANAMVTSGTMTNRIDQLERRGLVERRENPEDGRSVLIALTPAGFKLVDQAIEAHVENLHSLTGGLSESEYTRLDRLLTTYLNALEDDS